MNLELKVKHDPETPRYARIESNFFFAEGEWEEIYVAFSGFFGKYGPELFAAAPDLLEALRKIHEIANPYRDGVKFNAIAEIAESMITKFEGGRNE